MKVRIIKLGKPAYDEYLTLVSRLQNRLSKFVNFEAETLKSYQDREKDSFQVLDLMAKSKREIFVICDERGHDYSTTALAKRFRQFEEDPSVSRVTFIIGGPFGLNEDVRKAAHYTCRFGPGVLPSDLAWLVCTEQIYRSYCVNKNIKYHHE